MQAYDKRFWTADLEAKARREAMILKKASHPNVLDLLETVETSTSLILVTEHCTHGDLVKELVLSNVHDSLTVCARLKQIIQAVNYIHKLVRFDISCISTGCLERSREVFLTL